MRNYQNNKRRLAIQRQNEIEYRIFADDKMRKKLAKNNFCKSFDYSFQFSRRIPQRKRVQMEDQSFTTQIREKQVNREDQQSQQVDQFFPKQLKEVRKFETSFNQKAPSFPKSNGTITLKNPFKKKNNQHLFNQEESRFNEKDYRKSNFQIEKPVKTEYFTSEQIDLENYHYEKSPFQPFNSGYNSKISQNQTADEYRKREIDTSNVNQLLKKALIQKALKKDHVSKRRQQGRRFKPSFKSQEITNHYASIRLSDNALYNNFDIQELIQQCQLDQHPYATRVTQEALNKKIIVAQYLIDNDYDAREIAHLAGIDIKNRTLKIVYQQVRSVLRWAISFMRESLRKLNPQMEIRNFFTDNEVQRGILKLCGGRIQNHPAYSYLKKLLMLIFLGRCTRNFVVKDRYLIEAFELMFKLCYEVAQIFANQEKNNGHYPESMKSFPQQSMKHFPQQIRAYKMQEDSQHDNLTLNNSADILENYESEKDVFEQQ